MEKKINIAELLKDCPKNMELDCTICNGVKFIELDRNPNFPIVVRANNGYEFSLTKYGQVHNIDDAKCVIFPKGKTTWEGFVPPCQFKDGDVCCVKTDEFEHIFIFKVSDYNYVRKYANLSENNLYTDESPVCTTDWVKEIRFATKEEKQKLFDAIKAKGYKWNAETKTLEKVPKFKVGDRIKHKENTRWVCTITRVTDRYYVDGHPTCFTILFDKQNEYELAPDKFNINTLKPFDKVLVRGSDNGMWCASIFSHTWIDRYFCVGTWHNQCIPYEGNEHLLGTTKNCDEYFKTWE